MTEFSAVPRRGQRPATADHHAAILPLATDLPMATWPVIGPSPNLLRATSGSDLDPALAYLIDVTNTDTLSCLAYHVDARVRRLVADNPFAPSDVLEWLGDDVDIQVREVVRARRSPAEALIGMAEDSLPRDRFLGGAIQ